jgi:molybdenum cofactor biosynthesis enzyme MoaA
MNARFLICNNCNLKCDYCHNDYQGGIDFQISERNFSKEIIYKTLKEYDHVNIDNIKISGGEPFLKPKEVNEIIEFSSNINKKIVILTNATIYNNDLFNKIIEHKVHEIRINLPTFDISKYKYITKANDKEVNILYDNIFYFANNNIPITLNVVLICHFNEIKKFIQNYLKTVTTTYKSIEIKSIRFIINDWLPDKNVYFDKACKELTSLTNSSGSLRRGRIIDFNDYYIPISLIKCDMNEESDLYFIPPGIVLKERIKGKVYD